jgi:ATP-dependent Clp protease ATP-binding subunit ClpA
VLFGRLKGGGHVRVVVEKDDNGRDRLGFEYLEGPVAPKPDKVPAAVRPKAKRRSPRPKPKGGNGGNGGGGGKPGSVPKVPLVKA